MDCNAFSSIIKLLEDGCLSSQSLGQITDSLVKQTLKVIKSRTSGSKKPFFHQICALLENTRYLVHHNKGCFEHLNNIGFLELISQAIYTITEGINMDDIPDEMQHLLEQTTDTVLALSDVGSQAKSKVVLHLLPNIIELLMCHNLTFLNRLEILKNINILLEQCHVQTKDEFLKKSENQQKIISLVNLIQTIGDYEFQVGTVECLMRLFPRKLRQHYATTFMADHTMLNGFLEIKDRDFETDCRQFLNIINAKSEDPNQGVYSIPCLTAYVGNKELRKPSDTSYSEFWVDFNIGSQRVTIFCEQDSLMSQSSAMDEDLWETVAVYKTDVQNCICNEEEEGLIILEIQLKSPVCDIYPSQHQDVKDNTITIEFSSDLELHVSHAVAQTFRAPEKAKKVSTVEQPLQISLKEVQETDSQQSMSSAMPQKPYQSMRDKCSQESSSTRRHKVSVPSIPMCSPLIKADGSSGRNTHQNIQRKDNVSASKQTPFAEEPAENKTSNKDKELAPPRTPVVKSKSKVKVKTPVVVVTPLEEKPVNKKRKQKVSVKKNVPTSKETTENDLVIPDSLPVENIGTDKTANQPQKVSESIRAPEDSGIEGEISAQDLSEAAQTNQSEENEHDETSSSQVENQSVSSDNQVGIIEDENLPDESGDGKSVIKDGDKSTKKSRSSIDKRKKSEQIVESPTKNIEKSFETKDIDSIPDSFEGYVYESDENRASGTMGHRIDAKNTKPDETSKEIDKSPQIGDNVKETKKKEKQSKIKSVSLASLSKDHESLEELYKFDEIEMEKNKAKDNDGKSEDTFKEISNIVEQNVSLETDSVKDKPKSKKNKQNKSDISKKTKSKSNKENAENTKLENKTFENSAKETSKEPTRRSSRSRGKQPNYKDPDTSNITDLDTSNDTSIKESPKKDETDEKKMADVEENKQSKMQEAKGQKKKKKEKKTKLDITQTDDELISQNENYENEKDEHQTGVGESVDDSSQYSVDEPTFSPRVEDSQDISKESDVEDSALSQKKSKKSKHRKSKSKADKSKQVKYKPKSYLKENVSIRNDERCKLSKDMELDDKCSLKVKYDGPSDESETYISGAINVKKEISDKTVSKQYKGRGSHEKLKAVKSGICSMSDDEDSSGELVIEADDSYNARRYRLEVSQDTYATKQNRQSTKPSIKKSENRKTKTETTEKSSYIDLDDSMSLSEEDKKSKSKKNSCKSESTRTSSQSKRTSKKTTVKQEKQKSEQGSYLNKTMAVAYKGKVGLAKNDPFDSISSEPNISAKNKSMTLQMTYSKSKTSYRLFDWSATEAAIDNKSSYDPYDFESHWDNQSMKSDRTNKKITSAITSGEHSKTKKKKYRSKSHQEMSTLKSPISVHDSSSQSNEEDHNDAGLLVQDKETNKWHRRIQAAKPDSSKHKVSTKKTENKGKGRSKIKREEEQCMMMDTTSNEIPTDNYEDMNEVQSEEQEEEIEVKSFRDIMKEMEKEEKLLALPNILTPKTPKTVEFVDDNDYDFPKTPCTKQSSTRTPRIGSCRRKGYTPLSVSFVKTPQSAQISEKQDTESDDDMEERCSNLTMKNQAERMAGRKGRSSTNTKALESDKSWIAERRSSAKKKIKNRSKTYKKAKPTIKKSHYSDEDQTDDDNSANEEETNTQKLSCFTKALQQLRQATEMSSSDEPQDEPNTNTNLEICSLPVPSYFSSRSLASNPVTPSGKLESISLSNQILSPVTPYKSLQEEDDIQVVQTQENYALSFNTEDHDFQELSGYDNLMKRNLQTLLGDSGFCSGPSSEVRPSRSTLKRKYPDMAPEESDDGTVDSDSQSEKEEDRSTFIPKKLFKAEDMFKSVSTPKTLSIYSDGTEETELDMPFQSGISSFITAFGADIQKQFKAKRQRVEALTKETLKSTQKQLNQTLSIQNQHQSVLHDDYMNNIMFELSELTKDVDRLKEAEQKTEDFYKYQIKVLHDNEQSQRARIENMMKTHLSYKDRVYKARKHSVNVYKNLKENLKKDMSSLEHKLIRDVQKQELMNVKRGLQNMF